jgi:RNA polymerase sigma factor (sigma-70 family)
MSPGIRSYLLGTQSDDRLVGLVRGGSEPAFEALVHRYRRPLLRYCRQLCGSEARAEEALQQALMNVWVALRRGTEVRDVHAWLYRIAHNAAMSSMRGERMVLADAAPDDRGGRRVAALTPAVGVSSLDDVLAVRDAFAGIAALPQMQREVMVRTAVGGDSHEQVASALGISDGAVRGLLHRARCTLRAGLTAVTPTPLLTWASGGPSPVAAERIAELAAGGGAAGLSGIAAKGGVLAVTAGMAVAGSVIAGHHGRPARHRAPPTSARGQLSATAAGGLRGAAADSAVAGGSREGGAGHGMRALAGADRGSRSLRGRDGDGTNDRLAEGGNRDGGSSDDRSPSRVSGEGTSSSGAREGVSGDGGSSSTSSNGSITQAGSSSSDGGGVSSDPSGLSSDGKQSSGSGGSLASPSSDGKSGSLQPESQLQGSGSDGGGGSLESPSSDGKSIGQ